ncbi:hypothetical protein [uncultured Reyranella sp.]|uniref:hypothetical protein n=1 Tax=uncultured Reyranella sp. TaxID=735512 RepID=UPI0025F43833|nr:hypothetical protein [uncultured Reyranella sp.]
MEYVLIVLVAYGTPNNGGGGFSVPGFKSVQTCEQAAQQVKAGAAQMWTSGKVAAFVSTSCAVK